jgi:Tfp pilus assembly protein PilV
MATLIESLTALAVFAVGSSASAVWLAQSITRTHEASTWLHALAEVTELESRLRANPDGVRAGDYHYANPAPISCAIGCSPRAIAQDDLYRFNTDIRRAVGRSAQGFARCVGQHCTVHVRWPSGGLDWGGLP